MIVEHLREAAAKEAAAQRISGTPTGSRFGGCAAAMQQAMFPQITHPEPWQPRGVRVLEQGRVFQQWIDQLIRKHYPGLFGLQEQPFYYPVPLPNDAAVKVIASRLRAKPEDRERSMFWGWPIDGFRAPKILKIGPGKFRITGETRQTLGRYPPSVVLDRANGLVYLVTYVDGVVDDPHAGLTIVEQKQMSNFAFRRAILGDIEYRYRCQLIGAVVASGFESAVWVCTRKETMHQCEIAFRKGQAETEIKFTAPNGGQSVYLVRDLVRGGHLIPRADLAVNEENAEPLDFPGDHEWEIAQVWTPFTDTDRPQMDARILRVLLADGETWDREYGPDFRCKKCGGEGVRACKPCSGTGKVIRSVKKQPTQVPCAKCAVIGGSTYSGRIGAQKCLPCAGTGLMEETTLPAFPCGYCPTVQFCYRDAGVALRLAKGRKPEYPVTRAVWVASGLSFRPPETREIIPEDVSEETEDATETE